MAGIDLTREVQTEATMLEAEECDAALVDSTLPPASLAKLVTTATAQAILKGIALRAIVTADSG
jgi:hypothetical protein